MGRSILKRPDRPTPPAPAQATGGFSLAELMIALVILGLGLLFIAAALPIGVDYARETVDLAAGEAAAQYALEQIEMRIRTSIPVVSKDPNKAKVRLDAVVRPRRNLIPQDYPFDPTGEPFLKVRPLIGGNITVAGQQPRDRLRHVPDTGEALIRTIVPAVMARAGIPLDAQTAFWHVDFAATSEYSLYQNPMLPATLRVYPPIVSDRDYAHRQPDWFFASRNNMYEPWPVLDPNTGGFETLKAAGRRLVWTAFYRRVAYDRRDAQGRTVLSDPLLYEFIVFVCRRPSEGHYFARQNPATPVQAPRALGLRDSFPQGDTSGPDRIAPEPWLVAFRKLPTLRPNLHYRPSGDRPLVFGFQDQANLTFECDPNVGRLLPVGSYIIPAVNDDLARNGPPPPGQRKVGFVPHAVDTLPIYKVVQRPDNRTVVVENNGFYPWLGSGASAETFLCWVIPPAHTQRDGSGQPIFEKRSPIVSVARRTIRLPEIPAQ